MEPKTRLSFFTELLTGEHSSYHAFSIFHISSQLQDAVTQGPHVCSLNISEYSFAEQFQIIAKFSTVFFPPQDSP